MSRQGGCFGRKKVLPLRGRQCLETRSYIGGCLGWVGLESGLSGQVQMQRRLSCMR